MTAAPTGRVIRGMRPTADEPPPPPPIFRLRKVVPADEEPLFGIHAACFRALTETRLRWDARDQRRRFAARSPGAVSLAIEIDDALAGLLIYVDRPTETFVERITIAPPWQRRGFGAAALRWVVARADAREVAVSLSVWENNRARRLYERLGFRIVRRDGFRLRMRRERELGRPARVCPGSGANDGRC